MPKDLSNKEKLDFVLRECKKRSIVDIRIDGMSDLDDYIEIINVIDEADDLFNDEALEKIIKEGKTVYL